MSSDCVKSSKIVSVYFLENLRSELELELVFCYFFGALQINFFFDDQSISADNKLLPIV